MCCLYWAFNSSIKFRILKLTELLINLLFAYSLWLFFCSFFDEKLTISFTFHFRFSSFYFYTFFCAYFHSFLRLFHSKLFNCIVMECMNNHLIIICNALMLVLVIFTNAVIFFFRYCCLRQFKLHPPRAMKWNNYTKKKVTAYVWIYFVTC